MTMKKAILFILAAAALTMAGCTKDDTKVSQPAVKSLSMDTISGGVSILTSTTTPTYDANGRLIGLYTEVNSPSIGNISKSTTTFEYDDASHTAVVTSNTESQLSDGPYTTNYHFDSNWKVLEIRNDEGYGLTYTYDGDRLYSFSRSVSMVKSSEWTITWTGDDITKIVDESATTTLTYTTEANPFTKGLDPIGDDLLTTESLLGLTGRRTAHLPETSSTVTSLGGSSEFVFEYKKDDRGRIVEISKKGVGKSEGKGSFYRIEY